jgi:hypothetical protein
MNRKMLITAMGACALVGAAVPAYAQGTTPTGLSLKLGVLWPTDSAVRSATSDTWFTGGIEYRFKDMPVTTPNMKAHLSISADFAENHHASITPVLLNYVADQNQTYWLVGAGAAFLHAPGDDRTKFAYQAGLGYNFEQGATPVFLEARYVGTSESHANAVLLDVGIRF